MGRISEEAQIAAWAESPEAFKCEPASVQEQYREAVNAASGKGQAPAPPPAKPAKKPKATEKS